MEREEMKRLKAEHERRPLRIHELVPDFTLEDVWALPVRGDAEGFGEFLEFIGGFDPSETENRPARFLWGLRDRLGRWFDLGEISSSVDGNGDGGLAIPGSTQTSLRERLPADLQGSSAGFEFDALPFVPLYRTEREAAAEVSNKTVHGVAHFAWVKRGDGRYQGQMAVYVKPRGAFGRAYMTAIKPFRYLVVYPALMREIGHSWSTSRERGCKVR
jgi:hypothetical protein